MTMTRTKSKAMREAMREAVETVAGGLALLAVMAATYMILWVAL